MRRLIPSHPSKSKATRSTIQFFYWASQFLSMGAAFAGSLLGAYDYAHPNTRRPTHHEHLIWIAGISLVAATIGSFTAHKFQGQKIGLTEDAPDELPRFNEEHAPPNTKSLSAEIGYLTFAVALDIANNYLLIAGLNAFFNNSKEPILPPGATGIVFFLFKCMLVDLPFDSTNGIYEACEEIKKSITGHKSPILLSKLYRPIAMNPKLLSFTIGWLHITGAGSHTGTDVLGFLLSMTSVLALIPHAPKIDTFKDFTNTPGVMIPILLTSMFLLVPNIIQTLYFEARESKENLEKIRDQRSPLAAYPLLRKAQTEDNILRRLLLWQPRLKSPVRKGFYTQGPLHAFGDLMPVVLFLRDIFDRFSVGNDTSLSIITTVILGTIVFGGSCAGTNFSEVSTAVRHYNSDFRDIKSTYRP